MNILLLFCVLTLSIQPADTNSDSSRLKAADILEKHLHDDVTCKSYSTILELIELATSHRMVHYYNSLDSLYFNALFQFNPESDQGAIQYDFELLELIADESTKNKIRAKVNSGNKKAGPVIANFWQKLNPNPAHSFNIRLFEHWERIAYARENFTRRNNPPLGTDDRGIIFLKYGSPDIVDSGLLTYDSSRIRGWIREFNVANGVSVTSTREINDHFLANLIGQYFSQPSYSIWIYKQDNSQNLIYIFGEDANGGRFGLRGSLDDMLPQNAFRQTNELSRFNTGPSSFLQLMMYDRFSRLDTYFSEAFHELERNLLSPNQARSPGLSLSRKSTHGHQLSVIQRNAPEQSSDYESRLHKLDMNFREYRIVDEDGNRKIISLHHLPPSILSTIELYGFPVNLKVYGITDTSHFETISDTLLTAISEKGTYIANIHSPYNALNVTTFHLDDEIAETFGHYQIGVNRFELSQQNIPDDGNQFYAGDLILGTFSENQSEFNNPLFPFDLEFSNNFTSGKQLRFLLTVQHQNEFSYRTDVQILKQERRKRGRASREENRFSYTIEFHSLKGHDYQLLEIDTGELEQGNYLLRVDVLNLATEETIQLRETFSLNK
jgi:GWxTD domain-containing protein